MVLPDVCPTSNYYKLISPLSRQVLNINDRYLFKKWKKNIFWKTRFQRSQQTPLQHGWNCCEQATFLHLTGDGLQDFVFEQKCRLKDKQFAVKLTNSRNCVQVLETI